MVLSRLLNPVLIASFLVLCLTNCGAAEEDTSQSPANEFTNKTIASAAQGNTMAQVNLGVMYTNGWDVTQDYKEAVRLFRLAAAKGDARAQFNLGLMYHNGQGVIQDYKEAVRWYRLAATQGNTKAHYSLGLMHARGHGVIRNNVYAHMWFNIAAISDSPDAVKARGIVSGKMTAADISKAQDLARDCVKKNYNAC